MNDFGERMTLLPDDDAPEEMRRTTWDMPIDVKCNSQHVTRLHLKEPNGRQIEAAEKEIVVGGANVTPYMMRRYQITLIAQVARVPREVVESMPVSQIEEAFGFLSGLLNPGQRIGGM
jgi:hypothetical protein